VTTETETDDQGLHRAYRLLVLAYDDDCRLSCWDGNEEFLLRAFEVTSPEETFWIKDLQKRIADRNSSE
jgi:hypothetical protein